MNITPYLSYQYRVPFRGRSSPFSKASSKYLNDNLARLKEQNKGGPLNAMALARIIARIAMLPDRPNMHLTVRSQGRDLGLRFQTLKEVNATEFSKASSKYLNDNLARLKEQNKDGPLNKAALAKIIVRENAIPYKERMNRRVQKQGNKLGLKFQTSEEASETEFSRASIQYLKKNQKELNQKGPLNATALARIIARIAMLPARPNMNSTVREQGKKMGLRFQTPEEANAREFSIASKQYLKDHLEELRKEGPLNALALARTIAHEAGLLRSMYQTVRNQGQQLGLTFRRWQKKDRVLLEQLFGKSSKYGLFGRNGFIPHADPKTQEPYQIAIDRESLEAEKMDNLADTLAEGMAKLQKTNLMGYQLLGLTTGYILNEEDESPYRVGISLEEAANTLQISVDEAKKVLNQATTMMQKFMNASDKETSVA